MKKKIIFLLITILVINTSTKLIAQQSVYTNVYYDIVGNAQAYSVINTFDHKYMVAGERDGEAFIMKIDTFGNILFGKKIGNNYGEKLFNVISTNDSCYIAVGQAYNINNSTSDALCVKFDSLGNIIWSKTLDFGDQEIAYTIQQTFDHGYILCGFLYQTQGNFIAKLDSSGILSWSQMITSGNYSNVIYSVKQTPDSNFIAIGKTENSSPYRSEAYLIKFSPTGTIIWSKKPNLQYPINTIGVDLVVTSNGIISYLQIDYSIVILKTDFSGNAIWSRKYSTFYGYSMNGYPSFKILKASNNCTVFLNSNSGNGGQLFYIDSIGTLKWASDLMLIASDVIETNDNGFLVIGNGPIMGVKSPPTGNPQIGVMKIDSLGNSSNCINPNLAPNESDTISLIPILFTSTSGGTSSNFYPIVSNSSLLIEPGDCVAFLGNIKEQKIFNNEILVTPNPSNGIINITTNNNNNSNISDIIVYNVIGDIVFESSNSKTLQTQVDLSILTNGIYFIKTIISEKTFLNKIVISH
ncbi:MAG: T9SS type A sorting domain-containing protein [Bacteroidia bacterium]|nr:T9SS type A sorting domain-containing protein [Bacteroidia bacterium]